MKNHSLIITDETTTLGQLLTRLYLYQAVEIQRLIFIEHKPKIDGVGQVLYLDYATEN